MPRVTVAQKMEGMRDLAGRDSCSTMVYSALQAYLCRYIAGVSLCWIHQTLVAIGQVLEFLAIGKHVSVVLLL